MTWSRPSFVALFLIALSISLLAARLFDPASASQGPGPAIVGVWSNTYKSSNITDTTLSPGSQVVANVNVTHAPAFNAYEFYLFYDPAFLNATSFDITTGTVFPSPFLLLKNIDIFQNGTIHLAATNLGYTTGANGTLAHITFNVLGVGVSPLTLAAGMSAHAGSSSSFTVLKFGGARVDVVTTSGYFKNVAGKFGPVASFTFKPSPGIQGHPVAFDATGSYDPYGGGIREYLWSFGDGVSKPTKSPILNYTFGLLYGNFSVRLTVIDADDNFQGMQAQRVQVSQFPFHDMEVRSVTASPSRVTPGQNVTITVVVFNNGTFTENFNLTVSYGELSATTPVQTLTNQSIAADTPTRTYTFNLSTQGLATGYYTVEANIIDPDDQLKANDSGKGIFQVVSGSSSTQPLIFIAAVAGAVAVVASVAVLLKRRRKAGEPR